MGANTLIPQEESSIKTIDVAGPRRDVTSATLDKSLAQVFISYNSCLYKFEDEVDLHEALEDPIVLDIAQHSYCENVFNTLASVFYTDCLQLANQSNAVADVVPSFPEPQQLLSVHSPVCIVGSGFSAATLNVVDKKYSEVFQEVFSLWNPED